MEKSSSYAYSYCLFSIIPFNFVLATPLSCEPQYNENRNYGTFSYHLSVGCPPQAFLL